MAEFRYRSFLFYYKNLRVIGHAPGLKPPRVFPNRAAADIHIASACIVLGPMIRGKLFDFEEVCDGFDCGAVGGIDLYIGCKIFFFYLISSTYSTKSSSKYKYLNYNNRIYFV